MEKNLDINLGNLKINHICFLYTDVEKQAIIALVGGGVH